LEIIVHPWVIHYLVDVKSISWVELGHSNKKVLEVIAHLFPETSEVFAEFAITKHFVVWVI